jgi:hypothetical protein
MTSYKEKSEFFEKKIAIFAETIQKNKEKT